MSNAVNDAHAKSNLRRVVISSLMGAVIEWYDFFLYGVVAGLVFNKLFFPSFSPGVGTILAFATFAVGFVARPLGGFVFGHFGDKIGRKKMLILTLEIMGVATVLIGCIPSYDSIGIWAPILLVTCRLAQGIGLGGEWGGAVLMAFESAPANKRAFYGSLPQVGLSIGLMLASGVIGMLSWLLPDEAFIAWGWRLAFVLSAVLVLVGAYIRTSVQETQDFASHKEHVEKIRYPMLDAFKRYPKTLLACVGARVVEGIAFNVFGVFSLTYLTNTCGVSRTVALMAVVVASAVMAVFIPLWGAMADRTSKGRIFGTAALLLGVTSYPVFWVLHNYATTNLFFVYLAIIVPFGIVYAAAYASMASLFSDSFDPTVRYSSISFVYQFSGIFASGLTPMIATMLVQANGSQPWYLCGYLLAAGILSTISTIWLGTLRERTDLLKPATASKTVVANDAATVTDAAV
ncbi:MFS transporter [Desulfovibrio desulfuricans]|uniref:MFS transporter n=1 Tax=Desulfovibrio desulfuricans TaxID=876 RepID=A0A4P7ULQ7_DESDE|nr:MFS transporter [Desulfovibrio desulfuricans]QCC86777.1 MFS transporter [Desulfovibrio desulfuricans]